jgi:hypothetical protein
VILPDARRTPGATNPAVTSATLSSTICVSGWTARVRPSSSYTTALKREQLASGYAWHGDTSTADYEEDHLIPLELGGSPSSPANLWPEPYDHSGDEGAVSKDAVENRLHELVCSRAISLRDAQQAIASDWWLAARKYEGVPVASPRTSSPKPVVAAPRRSTPPPAPTRHSCTTTSSGNCIRGGQFCPKSDYGQTGYDASGTRYVCTGDASHPHWE